MRALFVITALLGVGCAGEISRGGGDGGSSNEKIPGSGVHDGLAGDSWQPPDGASVYTGEPVVYVHSGSQLFSIDPTSLQATLVGTFGWPNGADEMTDIALDRDGGMIGISFTSVYSVDPKTAACTFLAALQTPTGTADFTGLSYIAVPAADAEEVLMAAAEDGSLYEVNPRTGQSTSVGNFGGGLGSSGDLVSVQGLTLATVKNGASANDWLASIDPLTGQATLIGDIGFRDVWGLGYWKGKVYGFTEGAQSLLIDPKTGKGTLSEMGAAPWWGAGVTTAAPVIE